MSWLFPYLFGVIPLRGCLLGLNPQQVYLIKLNSHLLGCASSPTTTPTC